jgi:hypothetical protein
MQAATHVWPAGTRFGLDVPSTPAPRLLPPIAFQAATQRRRLEATGILRCPLLAAAAGTRRTPVRGKMQYVGCTPTRLYRIRGAEHTTEGPFRFISSSIVRHPASCAGPPGQTRNVLAASARGACARMCCFFTGR